MKRGYTYRRVIGPNKCYRCEILFSEQYPKVEGMNICSECEYELSKLRMNNDRGDLPIIRTSLDFWDAEDIMEEEYEVS